MSEAPALDPLDDPRLRDENLKRRFAANWVKKPDFAYPLIAEIIGTETPYLYNLSIAAYSQWPSDPFVIAEMQKIRDSQGEAALLPTREAVALEILKVARDAKTAQEKLAGYKLYNEMMGHNKPNSGGNLNLYTQKVLVVPDKGSEDNWSNGAVAQQQKLVSEARAEIDGLSDTRH